jgi:hypothetical protein
MKPFSAKRKSNPSTGKTICTKRGWKKRWKRTGRRAAKLALKEVVKIGTRAIISIEGKPMLATHWDGYPSSLGFELLHCDKSIKTVIEVAKRQTVDAADPWLLDMLNRERVRQLAEKHQLTVDEIRAGVRRGNVICADDYEIADIRNYGDWAEYEYDLCGKDLYFRLLTGGWPDSVDACRRTQASY